jgi:hypothetical protein
MIIEIIINNFHSENVYLQNWLLNLMQLFNILDNVYFLMERFDVVF